MREEDRYQQAIIWFVEAVAPDVVAFAIPNAARRGRGGKASNAVSGLRPGVADVGLILPNGVTGYFEVKTPTSIKKRDRGMSKEQLDFEGLCKARGVPHAVVVTIDDARDALARWNIDTKETRA